MEFRFTDEPIQLRYDDYLDVIESFKTKYEDMDASLYLIGKMDRTAFFPGFSDIDFMVISDRMDERIKAALDFSRLDSTERYIVFHDAIFLSPSLAIKFSRFMGMDLKDTVLLSGSQHKIETGKQIDLDFRYWDDLLMHNYRCLLSTYLTKTINLRLFLHKIDKMKYFIRVGLDKKLEKDIKTHCSKVLKAKKTWFEKDNKKDMIRLLENGLNLYERIIRNLDKKYSNMCNNGSNCALVSTDSPIIFKNVDEPTIESKRIFEKTGLACPIFPPGMSGALNHYSKADGIVSKKIRFIGNPAELKHEYRDYADSRICYYNEHAAFAKKHRLGYGPMVSLDAHWQPKNIVSKMRNSIKDAINMKRIENILNSELS